MPDGLLEEVTDITGITEVAVFRGYLVLQMLLDERSGFLGDRILILLQIHSEDLVKLFGSIVGEVDVAVETRLKTRLVSMNFFISLV